MKSFKFILIGIVFFFITHADAQVSVHVNIGTPPMWGPAGYDDVRYYYLPDVESYYDVQTSMFIYNRNGIWIHRTYLPARYRSYDLYSGYKVVMSDYRGNSPYEHFNEHRARYARGYRGEMQRTNGERNRGENRRGENHNERPRGDVFYNGKTKNRVDEHNDRREVRGNNKNNEREHGHGGDRKDDHR